MTTKSETLVGRASSAVAMLTVVLSLLAIASSSAFAQSSSDPQFTVQLNFNRWHDYDELKVDLLRLEDAFPQLLEYQSIGTTAGGRDMMLMTINNPETGPVKSKAAMFIDANMHGNEIQGGEVCLYTIWYLMENYGRIEAVTRLVDERVFFIMPTVNPDGRDFFMDGTGQGGRTGHVPVDDDNDGLFDEDGPEDLNGSGAVEQIRKYVPGQGTHRISHRDPRIMEPVPAGERGDYVLLGNEGMDNDGDGMVNEDGPGGYDQNRNWGAGWQPSYVQGGAMDYPFQLPASRAEADFMMAHPNIAGLQTYHNSGGMILRGPGSTWHGTFPASDIRVYDELGKNAERMLPYYDYMTFWFGLYTAHGAFVDWANDALGVVAFLNELWAGGQYFNSPDLQAQQQDPDSPISTDRSGYFFNDFLEFGDQYVEWQEFDHPQLGLVEMGGWKKTTRRIPPRFMNEELAHRNMAFTLHLADEMPLMRMGEPTVERISSDVFKVRVDLINEKVMTTILARAASNNVITPDLLIVDGSAEVISAGFVENKFMPGPSQMIDQNDLKRIMIRNGHPGRTTRTVEYLMRGSGNVTVRYVSVKGGTVEARVSLR